ncbi:MAG: Trm112 family protein [Pseudomonadota bacterium]|nr:Trm112 family protein [Pseudomonadota bacterium]
MAFNKELLDILVCPQCKKELTLTADENWLICDNCRLRYPIRDNIPIMLIDETKPLANENG